MGNTNCCKGGAADADAASLGKGQWDMRASQYSLGGERQSTRGIDAAPVRLNDNPATFGVAGFKPQNLDFKLLPAVQSLVDRFGLFTWLPVSPGSAGSAVYKATALDGTYIGQMHNDLREGRGYLLNRAGDLVACTFVQGQAEGRGAIYYSSGDYFEGLVSAGETREGKMTYQDGSYYVGQMTGDGYRHGQGVLHDGNGESRYEGTWTNNVKDGLGHLYQNETWKNGVRLDGQASVQQNTLADRMAFGGT